MSIEDGMALALAALLCVYLFVALLYPEYFE